MEKTLVQSIDKTLELDQTKIRLIEQSIQVMPLGPP
jgi:hypothetical protein